MGSYVAEIQGGAGAHVGFRVTQVFDVSRDDRVNRILCPALETQYDRAQKEN
jgi:hypothetical protein